MNVCVDICIYGYIIHIYARIYMCVCIIVIVIVLPFF